MSPFTRRQSPDEPIDILLVEEIDADIRLIENAFTEIDRETTLHVVSNPADAVDFLTQQGHHESSPRPNLVLLDLNIPSGNGREILDAVGDVPQFPRLPVIALTSSDRSEDIAACYRTHANASVTKPTSLEGFVSFIRALETFWFEHARLPPSPS